MKEERTIWGWVRSAIRAFIASSLVGIVPDVLISLLAAYMTHSGVKGVLRRSCRTAGPVPTGLGEEINLVLVSLLDARSQSNG
jgi:hypothetical protein